MDAMQIKRSNLTLSLSHFLGIKNDTVQLRNQNYYHNFAMEGDTPGDTSGCFNMDALTPNAESEFDDGLAVPESLSVITITDKPVLVRRYTDQLDTTGLITATHLPFNTLHNPPVKFKSIHRKVFIPGVEIKVKIIENERSGTSHLLNPNLYTILLQHGDFSWTIKKRYKHIANLHQQLLLYRASLNIPFPTKTHRERRASLKNIDQAERSALENTRPRIAIRRNESKVKKRKGALPRFPKKPEVMVPFDGIQIRMRQLEDYLYNLLNITIYRNHRETINFLEVSQLSFISELGVKGKEGLIVKRTGSTQPGQAGCNLCGLLQNVVCVRCNYFCTELVCARWQERWFFVKDSFCGYIRPKDGIVKGIMLYDQGFQVSTGMYATGLSKGIMILNLSRQMIIRCWSKRQSKDWLAHLKDVAYQTARDFTHPNLHHSFAPMRFGTMACPLVDGSDYLYAVADAMEAAREEIFIADWWLSPEVYMKRPALNGDFWRLDRILKRKAAQGVKIFILLYKEVEMALGINSYYSKQRLSDDNIKIFRHPDHAKAGVFFWAHHEKIVCIDQTIAFVGGIDLCYGRWDDYKHRLTDLGGVLPRVSQKTKKKTSSSPGGPIYIPQVALPDAVIEINDSAFGDLAKATNNTAIIIVKAVNEPDLRQDSQGSQDSTDDTGAQLPILQPGDQLLMPEAFERNPRHESPESQRKNVIEKITERGKDIMHKIIPSDEDTASADTLSMEKEKAERYAASNRNLFFSESEQMAVQDRKIAGKKVSLAGINEDREISKDDMQLMANSKLWIGKDYTNFIVKDLTNLDLPYVDMVDRSTTPRLPWHDVGVCVEGPAARDIGRHFIQRWNAVKLEKARHSSSYPYLLPKSYREFSPRSYLSPKSKMRQSVVCQVLRSVSSWSCGFLEPDTVEQSIHEAYIETITRAQHYVYIENQFFITMSLGNMNVRNQIGEAIFSRVLRAHRTAEKFRVFIVMPLLPAFEGEVGGTTGTSLHAVTHWNYQSICRGKDSLLNRLKEAGIEDPSKYVSFHGLRTYSMLDNEPVTELIYVHSKILIADDKTVICGSANINDRSMLGIRDSEIAVLIQDELFEPGRMNGEDYPSGKFAGSMRKHLFSEHLGILETEFAEHGIDVTDPCIDSFYLDVWQAISRNNTAIYEEVFHCIPTDRVVNFPTLKRYQEEYKESLWHDSPALAISKLEQVKGHLVDMPLSFLMNEVLTPPNTTMEGMLPTSLWT